MCFSLIHFPFAYIQTKFVVCLLTKRHTEVICLQTDLTHLLINDYTVRYGTAQSRSVAAQFTPVVAEEIHDLAKIGIHQWVLLRASVVSTLAE